MMQKNQLEVINGQDYGRTKFSMSDDLNCSLIC